jgi:hypothetical protein
MPLRFLLDENLRGPLWDALLRHNSRGLDIVDATRVGDPPDLPLGVDDPDILAWAKREERILVCLDKKTMATHLADHLASGRHSPGIFTLRPGFSFPEIVDFLVLAAHASDPTEWEDLNQFIPME